RWAAVLAVAAPRFGHFWWCRWPGSMAQGWAGFSEEELRRLKQTKGYKCPGLWSDSSRLMRRQTTKLCDSRYCKNLLQRQEEPHSAGDWMELGKISQRLCVSRGAFSRPKEKSTKDMNRYFLEKKL
ncbi:GORAB isoform 3, partial [Pongo abelii]